MNKTCRSIVTKMLLNGNKGDKRISRSILDLDEKKVEEINRINEFSKAINTSSSTFSRYIKKSGYPSFKHFSFDFNEKDEININQSKKEIDTSLSDYYTTAQRVSSSISKGRIYIIPSARGKSIGKLMNERLNDGGFDNKLFHHTQDNLKEFIEEIKGDTLFLITLSGYSRVVSKSLSFISDIEGQKPKIIILTAGKWMSMFEKGDFVSIGKIKNRDYKIDDWKNYNLCLLDILTLVILIINNLEKDRKKEKNE